MNKNKLLIFSISTFLLFSLSTSFAKQTSDSRVDVLEVLDWRVTGSWGAVAVVHHLKIKNSSDKSFNKIKIRIWYASDSKPGNVVTTETGVISLEIFPNSEMTYLKKGATLGAGSPIAKAIHLEILDAE